MENISIGQRNVCTPFSITTAFEGAKLPQFDRVPNNHRKQRSPKNEVQGVTPCPPEAFHFKA